MFDKKKLEAFLKSLEVETHYPSVAPAPPRSELDKAMDKYDLFKQGDYENLGTAEYPIWAKHDPFAAMSMMYAFNHALWPSFSGTYGGIARGPAPSIGSIAGYYANDLPKPAPSPYDSLKHKIRQLKVATPAKIADPTPPAPAKCPDYVGTLTGWRGWEVSGGLLEALGTDFTWEPRRAMRARCKREEHIAPSKKCACGFWSFKTSELLTKALVTYADHVSVIGTVEIWGRVIECKNGFRSEYSYPKELWLLEDGLESLSWRYGVPVRKL